MSLALISARAMDRWGARSARSGRGMMDSLWLPLWGFGVGKAVAVRMTRKCERMFTSGDRDSFVFRGRCSKTEYD